MSLKIRFSQFQITPGQPHLNKQKMLEQIDLAENENFDILVFPELCVPGYLIGDQWEANDFLRDCEVADEALKIASQKLTIIWGSLGVDWKSKGEDGHVRRYNVIKVAQSGEWLNQPNIDFPFFPKTLSPNYRLFDEHRYFYDLRKVAWEKNTRVEDLLNTIDVRGYKLAITLCEDGWDADYATAPMTVLQKENPALHINLSCSPFSLGKDEKRHRVFEQRAKDWDCPIVYLNAVSVQNTGKTFYGFDGRSTLYTPQSGQQQMGGLYNEGSFDFTLDHTSGLTPLKSFIHQKAVPTEIELITSTLRFIIKDYLEKAGLSKIVIGTSGGVDSAVNAALFATVVGPENLLLVNMPSQYNSTTTKNLAADLANNLGCWYCTVSIEESVEVTRKEMGHLLIERLGEKQEISLSPFHFENVQARDRSARILSALACSFGGVFTCNANKAEMTVGYSTLYGDLGGFLAPLSDLWKSQVYALGRFLNAESDKTLIPEGVFTVVPSAELSDSQDVDAGQGDPMTYWYHDALFRSWVEDWEKKTPHDLLNWWLDGSLNQKLKLQKGEDAYELFESGTDFISDLERWWKLFKGLGVVKRVQAPPVCAVSRRPFGFDWRESILSTPWSESYLELKESVKP